MNASASDPSSPNGPASGARRIAAAGWFIILLSAGTAALPIIGTANGAALIGGLLILAGIGEIIAGAGRGATRMLAIAAGAATVIAGLLFLTAPATHLLPAATIVLGWLAVRGVLLAAECFRVAGSVRQWTAIAAATDIVLALILAVGVSISTLVIALFGVTAPLIASFSWILAISFIATGLLLLEVASCVRDEAGE